MRSWPSGVAMQTNQANQGKAPADIVLTFGKYKGQTISEVYSR